MVVCGLTPMPSSKVEVCSSCAASVWPSYGLPGKLRAPTISPERCVTAKVTLTPNS